MITSTGTPTWVIVGLPAGVLIDRWDRRRTMVIALGVRGLVVAGLTLVATTGHLSIWWLVAAALLYGVTEVFADLAAQAQVPALVGRTAGPLKRANSRLLAVEQVANVFLGAPIAGALVPTEKSPHLRQRSR